MIEFAPIDENALINIDLDYYHAIYDGRLSPSQKEPSVNKNKKYPFPHMWELFVYAAILGFTRDRRKEIEKIHKPFRWAQISNAHQKNLLILALSKANTLDLIKDKENLKKSIEEYSNGGISIISQEIKNNPSTYDSSETFIYKILEEIERQV